MIAYLKFADQAAWTDVRSLLPAGVQIDELGVVFRDTGATQVVGGVTVPVLQASSGWHVNVIADAIPDALLPFLVNPAMPKRVVFGNQVLTMPEPMPEAGGTVMIERGVGQPAADEVIARIERALIAGRLTTEQAADRIARLQANLAMVDARLVRADRLAQRTAAIGALTAADAARLELIAQRDAQVAIRTDAIAQLQTLTGAARIPVVEIRDAAAAEIQRLTPLSQAAADARPGLVAARDAATAALQAATDALTAARAARDALVAQSGA